MENMGVQVHRLLILLLVVFVFVFVFVFVLVSVLLGLGLIAAACLKGEKGTQGNENAGVELHDHLSQKVKGNA
jgi:hypothetical protein